jgi:hypothetical protein
MKRFLSAEAISASTQRLINSRARDGLVHFLLLKRALARAQNKNVPFSSNDANFTGAMRDLAATYPPDIGLEAPSKISPFVKVFGTAGASKYVSGRWTTNGPADTLSGPKWNSVIHLEKTRPRRGSLTTDYVQHLSSLLLKSGHHLPTLTDTAIWYHRAIDIQAHFGNVSNSEQLDECLRAAFIEDLGLTDEEISLLFDTEAKPLILQAVSSPICLLRLKS